MPRRAFRYTSAAPKGPQPSGASRPLRPLWLTQRAGRSPGTCRGRADDQGDSLRGPDPRDRGQDGEPPGQARIGGDEAFDLRLEMGERGLDSADLALDLGDRHGDGGFAELVEERGAG